MAGPDMDMVGAEGVDIMAGGEDTMEDVVTMVNFE